MEVALAVAKVLALLAVAALGVYLIVLLSRVKQSLATIGHTVTDVATRVIPVLDNVAFLTAKVYSIAVTVEEQMGMIKDSVGALTAVTDSRVKGPIRETASVVRAVSKGVKTFIERVRT